MILQSSSLQNKKKYNRTHIRTNEAVILSIHYQNRDFDIPQRVQRRLLQPIHLQIFLLPVVIQVEVTPRNVSLVKVVQNFERDFRTKPLYGHVYQILLTVVNLNLLLCRLTGSITSGVHPENMEVR